PRDRSRAHHDRGQGLGRAGLRQRDRRREGQEPARPDRGNPLGLVSGNPPAKEVKPPPPEGAFFAQPPAPAPAVPTLTGSPRAVGFAVVALASAVALLYYGRTFFITVIFALFLSFAMRPFVSLLERARVPRVPAILLLLFVLIGALVLLLINVTAQL